MSQNILRKKKYLHCIELLSASLSLLWLLKLLFLFSLSSSDDEFDDIVTLCGRSQIWSKEICRNNII